MVSAHKWCLAVVTLDLRSLTLLPLPPQFLTPTLIWYFVVTTLFPKLHL